MAARPELDTALVVGSHGRHVVIETPEGRRLIAHPRGKKSACVVGDRVRWQPAGDEGVIEALEPRRNLLMRQDEWRHKSFAANIDQLLVVLAGEPMFSESQLTRALIAAEDAGIPATLLLNKVNVPQAAVARERLKPYSAMGYTLVEASLKRDPDAAHATLAPLLAGRATLVLGASGMGKSTLVNLLLRFYDVQQGRILVDGQDIAHVTQDSLRHQVGMVTQDTSLLHRSVRDNLLYARPEASDAQILAALEGVTPAG